MNFLTKKFLQSNNSEFKMDTKYEFSGLQVINLSNCGVNQKKLFAQRQRTQLRVFALPCFAEHVRARDDIKTKVNYRFLFNNNMNVFVASFLDGSMSFYKELNLQTNTYQKKKYENLKKKLKRYIIVEKVQLKNAC